MTDKTMAKRTNNDLQNITHKTKDRVTRTPLKTGGKLRCSGRVRSSLLYWWVIVLSATFNNISVLLVE
jgi:hypothetical protein